MVQKKSLLGRRKLLIGLGGVGTAAIALVISPLRPVIAVRAREFVRNNPMLRRLMLSLADAGYADWVDQIGTVFTAGGGTSMLLVAVTALNSPGTRPLSLARDRAFVAKFDVQNRGTMAGDLIYTTVHPRYGAFQMFLSASSDPNLPHRMTALFN
jgi:hypothetical protein